MKKRNVVGACVLALVVALSVPLGVHTSLTKLRQEASDSYYYDKTGYAIYQGLEERVAAARNLITVAQRYTETDPGLVSLIDEVEYAARCVEYSGYQDYASEAEGNQLLTQAFQALYDQLTAVPLSEEDEKYPGQLLAQMRSEQDKINRSSYNEDAQEFNARLEKFPVSLLRPIVGVEPLATFGQE